MSKSKAVVIASGGLDSVVSLYLLGLGDDKVQSSYHGEQEKPSFLRQVRGLDAEGYDLHVLSFNYGQRHKKELACAALAALRLGACHDIVDLAGITGFLKGSALTDDVNVPDGHYAAQSMAVTVVPNRNAIMLSIAYAVAVAESAEIVVAGFHTGDHYIYPDCRPKFVDAFDAMERLAVEGFGSSNLHLVTPFVNIGKHDIVHIGSLLDVPFEDTWSCYKGGEIHCGSCGTDVERREAFLLAGVADPTKYETIPQFDAP